MELMKTITPASLTFLIFAVITPFIVIAQAPEVQKEVVVSSWKSGTETVRSRNIRLKLSSKTPRFVQQIVGDNGTRYYLALDYMPYWRLSLEHWVVTLYEMKDFRDDNRSGWSINSSQELLSNSRMPRDWSDPQRIFIGVIYPENDKTTLQSNKQTEWFYPVSTARKINIAGFCVVLKVKKFKFSTADPTRVAPLDLLIRLRPPCKS
jgi:hypothetical protein